MRDGEGGSGRPADAGRALLREALSCLGIERFVLAVHERSLPGASDEDVGFGAPLSAGSLDFVAAVAGLGFDGLQLGPGGITTAAEPSPYDGSAFARSPLHVSLASLTRPEWGALLAEAELERAVSGTPAAAAGRVLHGHAERVLGEALRTAWRRLEADDASASAPLRAARERHRAACARFAEAEAGWLERDLLYAVLAHAHGGRGPWAWDAADARLLDPAAEGAAARRRSWSRRHGAERAHQLFLQYLAHAQHAAFREEARRLGLRLQADLQVGLSLRDRWAWPDAFLPGYWMGAPPSRTNPAGQPWGHPVWDPSRPGPMRALLRLRIDKAFSEYDAVRVDHPHGYVCPWVYDAGHPDPGRAVRGGARLLSSPGLPDHPRLDALALVRPEQLRTDVARHADVWVEALDPAQVERFAVWFDVMVAAAARRGLGPSALVCEVLSTLPRPVARVLERHGLGRFRVTSKADPRDPEDVYRTARAAPCDWVMVGTHDTRPLWGLAQGWHVEGRLGPRAAYLASRLAAPGRRRDALERMLATDPRWLAQAELADLFVGPARHVMVFFPDLLGLESSYNVPGTVDPVNWTLRVPRDWRARYRRDREQGRAMDVPLALCLALRAPCAGASQATRSHPGALALARRLEERVSRACRPLVELPLQDA